MDGKEIARIIDSEIASRGMVAGGWCTWSAP